MTEPRQRHIPLNINERRELDRHKEAYESQTGDVGDWGSFLSTVTLAGLAALGIYALGRAIKRAPTVWEVQCPRRNCGAIFPIRIPNPPPWRVAQVTCPNCSSEVVIDFAAPTSPPTNGRQVDDYAQAAGTYDVYCPHCQQQIEVILSGITYQGVEYLRCPHCGNTAIYGLVGPT